MLKFNLGIPLFEKVFQFYHTDSEIQQESSNWSQEDRQISHFPILLKDNLLQNAFYPLLKKIPFLSQNFSSLFLKELSKELTIQELESDDSLFLVSSSLFTILISSRIILQTFSLVRFLKETWKLLYLPMRQLLFSLLLYFFFPCFYFFPNFAEKWVFRRRGTFYWDSQVLYLESLLTLQIASPLSKSVSSLTWKIPKWSSILFLAFIISPGEVLLHQGPYSW